VILSAVAVSTIGVRLEAALGGAIGNSEG
jgi:hypothetical protein